MRRGGVSFILGEQELPLLYLHKCPSLSKIDNLKRGGTVSRVRVGMVVGNELESNTKSKG